MSLADKRLTPEARRLLNLLARLPAGLARRDLDVVLPEHAGTAASVLRNAGLAFDETARLLVLAPLREYVHEKVPAGAEDLARLSAHFVGLARDLAREVGRPGGREAVTRLAPEARNIEATIARGLEGDFRDDVVDAAIEWCLFVRFTGVGSSDLICRAADAAATHGDTLRQANCIKGVGDIALARSDYAEARRRYEEALALYRLVVNVPGEASCIVGLGDIALARSEYGAAGQRYEEALALYLGVGDVLGKANCIHQLGDIAQARSNYGAAGQRYEEALALYRETGEVLGEANCVQQLGAIALIRSDFAAAGRRYDEALLLYRQVGAVVGEANCILHQGEIALAQGDHATGLARFSEALILYEQVGELLGQGNCHFKSGQARTRAGRPEAAGPCYQLALRCYESNGDPYPIGAVHYAWAQVCDEPERTRHREAACASWRKMEREFLIGLAATDGISAREVAHVLEWAPGPPGAQTTPSV